MRKRQVMNENLMVRCTPETRRRLEERAAADGQRLAELLRRAVEAYVALPCQEKEVRA